MDLSTGAMFSKGQGSAKCPRSSLEPWSSLTAWRNERIFSVDIPASIYILLYNIRVGGEGRPDYHSACAPGSPSKEGQCKSGPAMFCVPVWVNPGEGFP